MREKVEANLKSMYVQAFTEYTVKKKRKKEKQQAVVHIAKNLKKQLKEKKGA